MKSITLKTDEKKIKRLYRRREPKMAKIIAVGRLENFGSELNVNEHVIAAGIAKSEAISIAKALNNAIPDGGGVYYRVELNSFEKRNA